MAASLTACVSTTKISNDCAAGEAIIQDAKGGKTKMSVKDAFAKVKTGEKIILCAGRVELTETLRIKDVDNVEVIGNKTELVAKVDMPVVVFDKSNNSSISGVLVVHEVGEWCSQNCLEIYNSSGVHVYDSKFDGSGYFGVVLWKASDCIIEKNEFYNCHYGFSSSGSSNIMLKSNSFSGNRGEDILGNEASQYKNDLKKDNSFK